MHFTCTFGNFGSKIVGTKVNLSKLTLVKCYKINQAVTRPHHKLRGMPLVPVSSNSDGQNLLGLMYVPVRLSAYIEICCNP